MTPPPQRLAGGTFIQGDDHHYPEEAPAREISVGEFAIDIHPVTNAQFAAFVAATGYITTAERNGAAVFVQASGPVDLAMPELWWRHEPRASWRRPRGAEPLTDEQADHPVVDVTGHDALAYAAWRGGRLPTETEWEWAAGGGQALPDTWPLATDGMLLANVWLGQFPWRSLRRAAPGTMPVGAFPPNLNGLFDMLGNVWELTADAWNEPAAIHACCSPGDDSGRDAVGTAMVAKGGSFLCAANYCRRYRPAARLRQPIDAAACHIGFRCAYDIAPRPAEGGVLHG